ncbi:MAG: DVUA0089 family protein [Planctomycetes bacterium]|nr:DVUA0089 family protein [Planctomycetota bacterium]
MTRWFAMLTVVAGLGVAPAMAQNEVEPNDSIAQANGPFGSEATISGSYAAYGDADFYRVQLTEVSDLTVRIWGPTLGVCPNGFDPILTIMDANGTTIAYNDDESGAGLCSLANPTTHPSLHALYPGTYYIRATVLSAIAYPAPYKLVVSAVAPPVPVTERFTYQGILQQNGERITGEKSLSFSLWSHPTSTSPNARIGQPITFGAIDVINGLVQVELEFTAPPSAFDGTERYLEISAGEGFGALQVLTPRQRLTATPYASRALKASSAAHADTATSATNADGAAYAAEAGHAQTATVASSVPWANITGKPSGFADGSDDTAGWNVLSGVTFNYNPVGINTYSPGAFNFVVNGTAAKPGGGSWSVFSDERLKHDITPMAGTLDRLLKLRGYTYEYNDDAVQNRLAMPGTQIGLLAQEVEAVFPDWVQKDAEGYRYVTERATTALMVEALRDLRAEKDLVKQDAQKQIDTLRTQNEELKARLERLEKAMGR